jgi:hypothetical protein
MIVPAVAKGDHQWTPVDGKRQDDQAGEIRSQDVAVLCQAVRRPVLQLERAIVIARFYLAGLKFVNHWRGVDDQERSTL